MSLYFVFNISQTAAEHCNIMHLVDRRWEGTAIGLGTKKVIGRVHTTQIQIGNHILFSPFSVLKENDTCKSILEVIIGLDLLQHYQCSIDLKNNVLVIGSVGAEMPFLPDTRFVTYERSPFADSRQNDFEEEMMATVKKREKPKLKTVIGRRLKVMAAFLIDLIW